MISVPAPSFAGGSVPSMPGAAVERSDAPGRIAPRVSRRVAMQERPVPDAALEAPREQDAGRNRDVGEPSVRRVSRALTGGRIVPRITRDDYRAAYHAVPFSLAEYRANPGYRHAAAMKLLTGEYPPVPATTVAGPAGGLGFGGGVFGGGVFGGPAFGSAPARGFPGLTLPGGVNGPPTFGPPPFVFDRIQGVVPTFVNRYQTPRAFLPRR